MIVFRFLDWVLDQDVESLLLYLLVATVAAAILHRILGGLLGTAS